MVVTLNSKGQITLPKEIRDALELGAGAKLDFSIQPDGTLTVRALKRSVSAIVGLLKPPAGKTATVEDMNRAVGACGVLDTASFAFENRPVLVQALAMYENSTADFPGCLIAAKNAAAGCEHAATFDRAMRGPPAVKLL